MKRKSTALLSLLLALLLALSGCTGGKTGTTAATTGTGTTTGTATGTAASAQITSAKDTLIVAAEQDSVDRSPYGSTSSAATRIKAQVYEPLIGQTVDDGKYYPLLATSWSWEDNNKTLVLKIRQGVKFHNGETMKASDCLFSLKTISKSGQSMPVDNVDFDKSSCPDDYTLKLALKKVSFAMIGNLTYISSSIFSEKGFTDAKGDFSKCDIGTGPYMWKDWVSGDHQSLGAFPDYWEKGKPYIKSITFKVMADGATRDIEVETGGADLAYKVIGADITRLGSNPKLKLYRRLIELDNAVFDFNCARAPFDNALVRRAFVYAFDTSALDKVALHGLGKPPTAMLSSSSLYPPNDKFIKYDLSKAKEALTQAGYPNGFNCGCLLQSNQQDRLDAAEYFQNSLKQIGVSMKNTTFDAATYVQKIKVERNFDICVFAVAAITGTDYALRAFYSTTPPAWNVSAYKNPAYDKLVDAADQEPDAAKRKDLETQAINVLYQDYPCIPIFQQEDVYVLNAKLQGVVDGPYMSPLLKDCYFTK